MDIRDVVRVFGITGLVTQLLESREDRRLEGLLKQLGRRDLLILDEWGYVPFTEASARRPWGIPGP